MLSTRNVIIALSSLLLISCLVLPLVAAAENEPQRDKPRMGPEGGMQPGHMPPQEMQKIMLERIKKELAPTDPEWTLIEPPLKKVIMLSNEINPRGMGMMDGRSGRIADQAEQSEFQKASIALREVTQKADSTPEEINAKLTVFRAAKEAAQKELTAAQDELRKVVHVRQEAKLVLMGMLN
jgi:hypothetical protein